MSHQRIRFITILTDLLLINAGFALAYVVRYQWQWFLPVSEQFFEPYGRYFSQQIVLNVLLIITFSQVRVWRRKRGEFWVDEMSRITYATAAGVGLMSMIAFFVQPEPFSRLMLVCVFLAIVLLVGALAFLPALALGPIVEQLLM